MKPPYAIGSVPSLSDHAIAYTDDVHCREFAGTGPVNLKVVPKECYAALAGHHGSINMRLSFQFDIKYDQVTVYTKWVHHTIKHTEGRYTYNKVKI